MYGPRFRLVDMITGAVKSQVDTIWNAFWSGGVSNPIIVIEQFTYLLFMRQLDDRQRAAEKAAILLGGEPDPRQMFYDEEHRHLRFSEMAAIDSPEERFKVFSSDGFEFIRTMGSKDESGFAQHMRTAAFLIPNAATLGTVVELICKLEFTNKDMTGDLYEYMLSKLSTAGTNGQFRTPSHIIDLIVRLAAPKQGERVIDPACGTAGFLAGAAEYTRPDPVQPLSKREREFYEHDMFHGFDFDSTMVRIAAMNMVMHGFSQPNVAYRDSLQELPAGETEAFDVVLANPPFAGTINADILDPQLAKMKSRKTELLFVKRFLTLLRTGGRAAVVVPEGVLFGSTKAHKQLRKELVENQKIDCIIKLPSGTFKPYTGVSTAILCFTRTDSPANDDGVWFYDVTADGRSLDDKRTPLLDEALLGPDAQLTTEQHEKNNLPDVVARFRNKEQETERARTEQSFVVSLDDIRDADYDLSMNRYKEIAFDEAEARDAKTILADIEALNSEIYDSFRKLKELV